MFVMKCCVIGTGVSARSSQATISSRDRRARRRTCSRVGHRTVKTDATGVPSPGCRAPGRSGTGALESRSCR